MIYKQFPLDKNYLLEEAQINLQRELVTFLIDYTRQYYLENNNPLGLIDDTARKIMDHQSEYSSHFDEFYVHLMGIYRYRHGKNQLELLFDGSNHLTYYEEEWKENFKNWVTEFCTNPNFVRAVLELSVFYPKDKKALLAVNRMKAVIQQHFSLKVYRYKGIVEMKVA